MKKWFIELKGGSFYTFGELVTMFLNHLQLIVCYDVVTELPANFEQDKAIHISDHIREWHIRKILIKAYIPNDFILEWFFKSLQLKVSKDVSLLRVLTKE